MEPNQPVITKRLWNIARIVFFMIRRGISKSKLMVYLHHMMTKRGKLAGKAIGNLMFHHHSFSCRSQEPHLSFVAPKEYEFSCSNSPAYPSYFPFHVGSKRKNNHHQFSQSRHYFSCMHPTATDDDITTVTAVQKILEMLNNDVTEASPAVLPGFGRSPMVRQLRITDSPFPLREADEDSHVVDNEAEEFIKRFYEQLRLQKSLTSPDTRWSRC